MQPTSGTPGRGRGRGRGLNTTGTSNNARGRGSATASTRSQSTPITTGQSTRGNRLAATRSTPMANGASKQPSRGGRGAFGSMSQTQGSWQQRFDKVCSTHHVSTDEEHPSDFVPFSPIARSQPETRARRRNCQWNHRRPGQTESAFTGLDTDRNVYGHVPGV